MDENIRANNDALPLPQKSSASDQLCSICSKISFRALLEGKYSEDVRREGRPEPQGSCDDIRLGNLQRISSTISCPACRLVSCCISLYCDKLSLDEEILLSGQWSDDPADLTVVKIGGAEAHKNVFPITIQTCRHAITPKVGRRPNGGPCRLTGIGVILPVRPRYSEEDVGSKTDDNRSASEGDLKIPGDAYARWVTPLINTRLVREWMTRCTAEHNSCCKTGFSIPVTLANIRLIDVQKKQVILSDMGCKYIALSYVWGLSTKGLLTRATLEKYTREGSLGHEDVPRTIRDAIYLVADLGERYLWVDSLCIIQDDLSDKRQFLPMMGEIYNAAMMVIVAAVENAHSGLPGIGVYKRRQTRMKERIQGIDFTFGQPQLGDYLQTTIWNTRGWTYQEAQLARRALVITDFQVYWSCCEGYWCEDPFTEFPTYPTAALGYNLLFIGQGGVKHHVQLCSFGEYCQRVKEFTLRSFSDEKDKLWAFFGILKSLLSKFPQGYIWGLPKAKLDSALLWKTNNSQELSDPLVIPTEKFAWQKLIIPSWCWISKGTEIWYDECYDLVESMVEWHEPAHAEECGPRNGSQEKGGKEEERTENTQSVIFLSDQISQESALFDFALLHFTTESTILRMHTLQLEGSETYYLCCSMGSATLSLLSGRDIGSIRLPIKAFSDKEEIQGEFILLSSTPIAAGDVVQESEEPKYNIMLVRWSDDNKVAYRVAWTEVTKSAWQECEVQRKTIILA
ncbi:heterokaryon incompatibility protein-domain-containing protein [Xylaria acuta]|nr:heterokaryon incompatibility protein-domain-containing protein [Xylaria acuta]